MLKIQFFAYLLIFLFHFYHFEVLYFLTKSNDDSKEIHRLLYYFQKFTDTIEFFKK